MSNYRRANTKGGTYFFTVVTYRRQKILCDDVVKSALREGIQEVQKPTHLSLTAGYCYLIIYIVFGHYPKVIRILVFAGR